MGAGEPELVHASFTINIVNLPAPWRTTNPELAHVLPAYNVVVAPPPWRPATRSSPTMWPDHHLLGHSNTLSYRSANRFSANRFSSTYNPGA